MWTPGSLPRAPGRTRDIYEPLPAADNVLVVGDGPGVRPSRSRSCWMRGEHGGYFPRHFVSPPTPPRASRSVVCGMSAASSGLIPGLHPPGPPWGRPLGVPDGPSGQGSRSCGPHTQRTTDNGISPIKILLSLISDLLIKYMTIIML